MANFSLFLAFNFFFKKETTRSALRLSASISKTNFKDQKDFHLGGDLNQESTHLMPDVLPTELFDPLALICDHHMYYYTEVKLDEMYIL